MQADKKRVLQDYSVTDVKKIVKELKWYIKKNKHVRLQHSQLNSNHFWLAEIAANKAGVPGFIDRLVVFIKQKWAKAKEKKNAGDEQYIEADSSWPRKYLIQLHNSITIWKAKGANRGQV